MKITKNDLPDFESRYDGESDEPACDIWYDFADEEFMEPIRHNQIRH